MRRGRRGGHGVLEFGGSGEDSFVAVVVTKLTGALLFILLLSMVIMALIPKAIDPSPPGSSGEAEPLAIATPERLPEAISGRPYELALSATGGTGPLRWAIDGDLPEGLEFDAGRGLIRGTPEVGTPGPVALRVMVSDGRRSDAKGLSLVVYRPDGPLTVPSPVEAALRLPRLPWRAWGELGLGFVMLLLVHMVAMNGVSEMERRSEAPGRRFAIYRGVVRASSLSAVIVLGTWLWSHRDARTAAPITSPESTIASAGTTDSIVPR
ncbi:Ig domain-containing protein [Tautonia sociabilis]|nr:Ig domain-containing protein [Tautonia sociabilis]